VNIVSRKGAKEAQRRKGLRVAQPLRWRGRIGFFGYTILLLLLVSTLVSAQLPISIKATNALQYDLVRFSVKPGSKITITLTNESDMSHNLIITKPGTRKDVVSAALQLAQKGPDMNFIPNIDAVLWSIPIISPGQSKSVIFTAPDNPGVYPYVCTYPGHGFVMYGAMYVTNDDSLPDITTDENIPESRRQGNQIQAKEHAHADTSTTSPHPYPLIPPYFYHTYIEGASPAAIAVHLPKDLSYCWDAGACRLRFAWQGGFIDMSDIWEGHFDASAKILGEVFYRDITDYPIRSGENATIPVVKYKGYRLIDRYPEFHYTLNGIDVYELIKPKEDGYGLIRDFRIPRANQTLWFFTNLHDDAIEYESSPGKFNNGKLKLSPAQAKEFTITMTSYHLAFKRKKE
jgi:azurin